MWLTVICCVLASASALDYGSDQLYDQVGPDYLLDELQKRLSYLRSPDAYYASQDLPDYRYETFDDLNDRSMQEDTREPEHLSHGSQNQGFQYISGGAGEGKQHLTPQGNQHNTQEVKSDESLPFYCHPPNPCPKGFTVDDGCQDFIQDTVEEQQTWMTKMMEKGLCTCDKEHMFTCPEGPQQQGQGQQQPQQPEQMGENPWTNGVKRAHVVAKKSPIVKRSVDNEAAIDAELDKMKRNMKSNNPYLAGMKTTTFAKKG